VLLKTRLGFKRKTSKMLLKINFHVMFLLNVIVYCYILYNMILDGKDLDINNLMM
jgi:hypothetical protein